MALADQIVKSLGIDPNALREALNRVVQTAQRIDANMIASQVAVKQASDHFDARLTAIERRLDELLGGAEHGVEEHARRGSNGVTRPASVAGDDDRT